MPKEIIYSAGAVSDDESGYHAKVGWTADREVQIGVEANGGRSLFWTLTGCRSGDAQDEGLRRIGVWIREALPRVNPLDLDDRELARAILNTLDAQANGQYAGVWVDLDRGGCNRLIRALRKARDAAYGRDE